MYKKFGMWYVTFLILLTLTLLVIHTTSLFMGIVDSTSFLLLVFLAIIPFLPELRKIKYGEFEAEIKSAEVDAIKKQVMADSTKFEKIIPVHVIKDYNDEEFQKLSNYLLHLVETDPRLAIAKIRMELEVVIRRIYKSLINEEVSDETFSIRKMIDRLDREGHIKNKTIVSGIKDILPMYNKVIHGATVDSKVTKEMIVIGLIILSRLYGHSEALKKRKLLYQEK